MPSLKRPSLRYASIVPGDEYTTHFFRRVVGVPAVSKEVLSQRTADYQNWIEAFARNHDIPIEWAERRACCAALATHQTGTRAGCVR